MKDGGHAFPMKAPQTIDHRGMSLRDYFAARVDISAYNPIRTASKVFGPEFTVVQLAECIATIRYVEADAMLIAREK